MSEVYCYRVESPTCPKCGYVWSDEDGVVANSETYTLRCEECDCVYTITPDVSVFYSSVELVPVKVTLDGEVLDRFSTLFKVYAGKSFLPPDGKGYYVTDENGMKETLVPISCVEVGGRDE